MAEPLSEKTLVELQELARERDIPGRSTMDKEQLVAALETEDVAARTAEIETRLAAAEEREAKAAARVAALEAELARTAMSAPAPVSAQGTVTVNHKGEVVSD